MGVGWGWGGVGWFVKSGDTWGDIQISWIRNLNGHPAGYLCCLFEVTFHFCFMMFAKEQTKIQGTNAAVIEMVICRPTGEKKEYGVSSVSVTLSVGASCETLSKVSCM